MAYREFLGPDGTRWEVWEVLPLLFERRLTPDVGFTVAERRLTPHRRAPVAAELRSGWLVFQSGLRKLRLAPVPADWTSLTSEELSVLLQRAQSVAVQPMLLPAPIEGTQSQV